MTPLFKVFPSEGFRNSQFQLVGLGLKTTVKVFYDHKLINEVALEANESTTFLGLDQPGRYLFTGESQSQTWQQEVSVSDSVRLGSGELKQAYIFDEVSYTFLLMSDRLSIVRDGGDQVWEENSLSPTNISLLDTDHLLLRTDVGVDQITGRQLSNFATFSLHSFTIVHELVQGYSLVHAPHNQQLWVYNQGQQQLEQHIWCSEETRWQVDFRFVTEADVLYSPGAALLFGCHGQLAHLINPETLEIKQVPISLDSAIGLNGHLYRREGYQLYVTDYVVAGTEQLLCALPNECGLDTKGMFRCGMAFELVQQKNKEQITRILSERYPVTESQNFSVKGWGVVACDEDFQYEDCTLIPTAGGTHLFTVSVSSHVTGIHYSRNSAREWNGRLQENCINQGSLVYHATNSRIGQQLLTGAISSVTWMGGMLRAWFDQINYAVLGPVVKVLPSSVNNINPLFTADGGCYVIADQYAQTPHTTVCIPLTHKEPSSWERRGQKLTSATIKTQRVIWYQPEAPDGELRIFNLDTAATSIPPTNTGLQEILGQHPLISDEPGCLQLTAKSTLATHRALAHPVTGKVFPAVPGSIEATSRSLHKVLVRRAQQLYLLRYCEQNGQYEETMLPSMASENYREAHLAPDGNFLMLSEGGNKYNYYDLRTNTSVRFFTDKFVEFDKSGNLVFEQNASRNTRVLDPLTMEYVPALAHHYYRFKSPDGRLYAHTSCSIRYYDRLLKRNISPSQLEHYRNLYDDPKNRNELFNTHCTALEMLGIRSEWISSGCLIRIVKVVEAGLVNSPPSIEIPLPEFTKFFNYAAFSHDSKWLGLVGKPGSSGGLIILARLHLNKSNSQPTLHSFYINSEPETAAWLCGISQTNYFATYDSNGHTYLIDLARIDTEKQHQVTISHTVKGKSFLGFSPSGTHMALSHQSYDPITLGGYGHKQSSAVYLVTVPEASVVSTFTEHGKKGTDTKSGIKAVAFSEDETQLMTISNDGVVVVRNTGLQPVAPA
ncbi:WD40 repeat domain-containing protein [Hymenobacter elongatus]|uniref:WD40 repeat domain-containing protein n=1 Tax=Hymenobacter elongatus TaxID=877208 RepID=A0A4Z0PNH3_9BACT|nr:hypothetical protein [Hymenobacter elongatus]TGE15977.1 hypothetical protein E5J99_11140 [Hymenobacter elongatus]